MITIWGTFTVAVPVTGPSIGGFAAAALGRKWTIWPLMIAAAFMFVVLFFFLPETYAPTILHERATRVRKQTSDYSFCTEGDIETKELPIKVWMFPSFNVVLIYSDCVY